MLEVRRDANFAEEPIGAEHRAELRVEELDGDWSLVPDVVREIDGGHAAGADVALDRVAAGEPGFELRLECGHERESTGGSCRRRASGKRSKSGQKQYRSFRRRDEPVEPCIAAEHIKRGIQPNPPRLYPGLASQ